MYDNFPDGSSPLTILADPTQVVRAACDEITRRIEGQLHASTLEEIGECYNAGHITPDPGYTLKLAKNYAVPVGEFA